MKPFHPQAPKDCELIRKTLNRSQPILVLFEKQDSGALAPELSFQSSNFKYISSTSNKKPETQWIHIQTDNFYIAQ